MKGAKELADTARAMNHRAGFYFDVLPHLDRLAAIDSAVPEALRVEAAIQLNCLCERCFQLGKAADIIRKQAGELLAARAEVERLKAERAALAQENARLINEVGNLDAAAREQRQRAQVMARGIAAYRVGGFTAGQVWENEEGKAVQ